MIKIGENPQNIEEINKFIAKSGDGLRGKIIALKQGNKQAIILAMNSSLKKDVIWGNLYLIKEKNLNEYPVVIERITNVPYSKNWKII